MRKAQFERRNASDVVEALRKQLEQGDAGSSDAAGPSFDMRSRQQEQTGNAYILVVPDEDLDVRRNTVMVTCQDATGTAVDHIEVSRYASKRIDQDRAFATIQMAHDYLDVLVDRAVWDRLLTAIKSRERSAKELERRLRQEGFDTDRVYAAIRRARSCQLIDDARYGAAFVHGKIRSGWGRDRIERELRNNEIEPQSIPGYPEKFFSSGSELDRAMELLARKRVPEKNPQQKLSRFLLGRGFSPSVSIKAARMRVAEDAGENG